MVGAGVSVMDDLGGCLDLLDRFMAGSDGRSQRARAHPVAALTLAAAAVLAGMRTFTAIAGWVRDVPVEIFKRLYARCDLPAGMPSRSTLWRVLTSADPGAVDHAVGAWLAARYAATVSGMDESLVREALMVDGKTLRGAVSADDHQVHLFAVATRHHAFVLAQTDVGAKTNEIPKSPSCSTNSTSLAGPSLRTPSTPSAPTRPTCTAVARTSGRGCRGVARRRQS